MLITRSIIIILSLLSTALGNNLLAQEVFLPNQGQWKGDFHHKAYVSGGVVYCQNNGFTLMLYNQEQMEAIHKKAEPVAGIDAHALQWKLLNANPKPKIVSSKPTETVYNFYLGDDERQWASGLHAYKTLEYQDVYPNIHLRMYFFAERLKYEFVVEPGGDPSQISIGYQGADSVFLANGQVKVETSLRSVIDEAPVSFLLENDAISASAENAWHDGKEVATHYAFNGQNISFNLEAYDSTKTLVIDPSLIFSTFSGSYADNFGYTATYDNYGQGYAGGTVFSDLFPTTTGAYQIGWAGGDTLRSPGFPFNFIDLPRDIGILKFSSDGKRLLYATYLGGSSNEDPHSMVVNSDSQLVVFGNTASTNFPTTSGAYDRTHNGDFDIYVARFSTDGTQLLSSTFVGGSGRDGLNGYHTIRNNTWRNTTLLGFNYGDHYRGEVVVDKNDDVFVVTSTNSRDLPTSGNSYQDTLADTTAGNNVGIYQDGCVLKLSDDLSKLEGITYFGGYEDDAGYGIAIDTLGNPYVCGGTRSNNIVLPHSPYQDTFTNDRADGVVLHYNSDLSQLLHGTYLGEVGYDQTYFVQVDSVNGVYVTGQTLSNTWPVKNVDWSQNAGKHFITKLSPELDTLTWSSTFGPNDNVPNLAPSAFLVDECGRIYFSGWGGSVNYFGNTFGLTTSPDANQRSTDGSDFYLAVWARNMDTLLYATYFGGNISQEHVDGGTSRFDENGIVYQSVCAGCGGYSDFPTTPSAYSRQNRGIRPNGDSTGCNNALFKLDMYTPDLVAEFDPPSPCVNETITLRNTSSYAKTFVWDFGDGSTSKDIFPEHQWAKAGQYEVLLIASNPQSCVYRDTFRQNITVVSPPTASFTTNIDTCNLQVDFVYNGQGGNQFSWEFGDGETAAVRNPSHQFDSLGNYAVTLMIDTSAACGDTVQQNVVFNEVIPDWEFSLDTCDQEATLRNLSQNAKGIRWQVNNSHFSSDNVTVPLNVGDNTIQLFTDPFTDCPDTATQTVSVPPLPIANFSFRVDSCSSEVGFTNTSQNASDYLWQVLNQAPVRTTNPAFNFADTGDYVVRLTANPFSACSAAFSDTVKIRLVKFPAFSVEIDPCTYEVTFTDESRNPKGHLWLFGDGDESNAADPGTHQYTEPGTYRPTLVIDPQDSACRDSFQLVLGLDSLPEADFSAETEDCLAHIRYANQSKRAVQQIWYFADGSVDSTANPDQLYGQTGNVATSLVVISANGCRDSISQRVEVDSVFKAGFTYQFDTCAQEVALRNTSIDAYRFVWSLNGEEVSTQRSPKLNIALDQQNELQLVINQNSRCADSLTQNMLLDGFNPDSLLVPNVVTPNGDGINDVWKPAGLNSSCDVYEVVIFNRWGERIYEQSGREIAWKPESDNGTALLQGTYFYIFSSPQGKQHGTITILY